MATISHGACSESLDTQATLVCDSKVGGSAPTNWTTETTSASEGEFWKGYVVTSTHVGVVIAPGNGIHDCAEIVAIFMASRIVPHHRFHRCRRRHPSSLS